MSVVMLSLTYLLSKVGLIKPATRSKAIELIEAAHKAGHRVRFVWGMGGGEHSRGTALDIMVDNEAAGDFVRNYTWANRARLQLQHVIWEQHITSTVVQPGVRRSMADRGNTTANHYDHNHIKFLDNGADYKAPPSTPVAVKPAVKPPVAKPAVTVRTMRRGVSGKDVAQLQRELKRVFPLYAKDLKADGSFGPGTEKDVIEFQRRSHLVRDGKVGPKTRAAMRQSGMKLL